MKTVHYRPIGIIHSPFKDRKGTPIQPIGGTGVKAEVEIFPDFIEGLADLNGFSHIILLYHFHLSTAYKLKVKPFLDHSVHGVFATRAPARPNPIGISVVHLLGIDHQTLYVEDVDIIDQTPLLDIKPFVPDFDLRKVESTGWLGNKVRNAENLKADGRFTE
ncbi:MAG: tRNA (N6-threonylcarbamoyladenosine(37)-N6)-methyltransferase TrmO [Desulfobacterales bacterium]